MALFYVPFTAAVSAVHWPAVPFTNVLVFCILIVIIGLWANKRLIDWLTQIILTTFDILLWKNLMPKSYNHTAANHKLHEVSNDFVFVKTE